MDVQFVSLAIDSLLAQTYPDFKLFIIDDCSDDGTYEVLMDYQNIDNRVKVFRNSTRVGMIKNYRKAFNLVPLDTDYFAWASGHDEYDPDWLKSHIEMLNNHAKVLLVYSQNNIIDSYGNIIGLDKLVFETTNLTALERIDSLEYYGTNYGNMIYGLFRYSKIKENSIQFPPTLLPDVVFLYELSLYGEIAQIKLCLWSRRFLHSRSSIETIKRQYQTLFLKKPWYFSIPYQLINTVFLIWKTVILPTKSKKNIDAALGFKLSIAFLNRYALRMEEEYRYIGRLVTLVLDVMGKRTIFIQKRRIRKLILHNFKLTNENNMLKNYYSSIVEQKNSQIKKLELKNLDLKKKIERMKKNLIIRFFTN